MDDLDPTLAATPDDLVACLRNLHLRADKPSLRELETRTTQAGGLLPGTNIKRMPLRRATISDVLAGEAFPRKAFLLTFVEALGVDLNADRRWADVWDRLAQDRSSDATVSPPDELADLRRQLASAEQEISELREQLAALNQQDADTRTRVDEPAASDSGAGIPGMVPASRERIRAFLVDMAAIAASITDDLGQRGRAQRGVARAAAGVDLALATDIARSITDTIQGEPVSRDLALADIARVVATTDPDLAVNLARSSSGNHTRAWAALADVAWVVVAKEPDRAMEIVKLIGQKERQNAIGRLAPAVVVSNLEQGMRMARSITYPSTRASVLANVARAVMPADAYRAAQLTAEALETIERLPDSEKYWWVLRDVAQAVAVTDPAQAVNLLSPISDKSEMARALTAVAQAVAVADPDHAARIAQSITSYESDKWDALTAVARAAAISHPSRAEQIARSITDDFHQSIALSEVAQELAAYQPGRAERIAWLATGERDKAKAMAYIAYAVAGTNPPQAAALTAYLTDTADQLASEGEIRRLAELASSVAATHPALAEQEVAVCLSALGASPDEDLRRPVLELLCAVVETITTPQLVPPLRASARTRGRRGRRV
jgi:hypothetical protein